MSIRGIVSGISQTKISINDSQKLCEKYKNASLVRFFRAEAWIGRPLYPCNGRRLCSRYVKASGLKKQTGKKDALKGIRRE